MDVDAVAAPKKKGESLADDVSRISGNQEEQMNDNGLRRWWIDIPAGGHAGRLLSFMSVFLLQFTAFPDSAQAQWTEVALPGGWRSGCEF